MALHFLVVSSMFGYVSLGTVTWGAQGTASESSVLASLQQAFVDVLCEGPGHPQPADNPWLVISSFQKCIRSALVCDGRTWFPFIKHLLSARYSVISKYHSKPVTQVFLSPRTKRELRLKEVPFTQGHKP